MEEGLVEYTIGTAAVLSGNDVALLGGIHRDIRCYIGPMRFVHDILIGFYLMRPINLRPQPTHEDLVRFILDTNSTRD